MAWHVKVSRTVGGVPQLHDVVVPNGEAATVGDLRRNAAEVLSIEPASFRILFRGRTRADDEPLATIGAKQGAKFMVVDRPGSVAQPGFVAVAAERPSAPEHPPPSPEETAAASLAIRSIRKVRRDVDDLQRQLDAIVAEASTVQEKTLLGLGETLTRQLLALDQVESCNDDDVRGERRAEVKRVQCLLDVLDGLKSRL